jgi:uncharacterized protein YjbI with pentapeptide repeats
MAQPRSPSEIATATFRRQIFVGVGADYGAAVEAAFTLLRAAGFVDGDVVAHRAVSSGVDFRDTDWRDTDWRDTDWRDTDWRDTDWRDTDWRDTAALDTAWAGGPLHAVVVRGRGKEKRRRSAKSS